MLYCTNSKIYLQICLIPGSNISGKHSGAFIAALCFTVGDSATRLRGLAARSIRDSTRNWEPRDSTSHHCRPNRRASSDVRSITYITSGLLFEVGDRSVNVHISLVMFKITTHSYFWQIRNSNSEASKPRNLFITCSSTCDYTCVLDLRGISMILTFRSS